MKKCLAVVVGIVALLMLAPMASASYIACQTTGSFGGNVQITGQPVTLTCPSVLIPTGTTLTGVDISLGDDAQGALLTAGSTIQWTWVNSVFSINGVSQIGGGSQVNQETSTAGSSSFANCAVVTAIQSGDGCNPTILHYAENVVGGSSVTFGTVQIDVKALLTAGPGLNSSGGESVTLAIQYDYSSNVPEPATLGLMGAALFGLGIFGKRFSRR